MPPRPVTIVDQDGQLRDGRILPSPRDALRRWHVARGQQSGREDARLDSLRQLDLLLGVEEGDAADLIEVGAHQVRLAGGCVEVRAAVAGCRSRAA